MKVSYCSDLHLEFQELLLKNDENSDVLILAGDICVIENEWLSENLFFEKISEEFRDIIYVLGNHEFYHGNISSAINILREKLSKYDNIHILDDDFIEIGNARFLGSTFWTDLNKDNPVTKEVIRNRMNDMKVISDGVTKFNPDSWLIYHNFSKNFIFENLTHENNVVITHHAPSILSIHEDNKYDFHMNGGYRSDIENEIMNHDIKFWIHGHTHNNVDYNIENCRVLSNQRGYPMESLFKHFYLKSFEI